MTSRSCRNLLQFSERNYQLPALFEIEDMAGLMEGPNYERADIYSPEKVPRGKQELIRVLNEALKLATNQVSNQEFSDFLIQQFKILTEQGFEEAFASQTKHYTDRYLAERLGVKEYISDKHLYTWQPFAWNNRLSPKNSK